MRRALCTVLAWHFKQAGVRSLCPARSRACEPTTCPHRVLGWIAPSRGWGICASALDRALRQIATPALPCAMPSRELVAGGLVTAAVELGAERQGMASMGEPRRTSHDAAAIAALAEVNCRVGGRSARILRARPTQRLPVSRRQRCLTLDEGAGQRAGDETRVRPATRWAARTGVSYTAN